jgi:hypothetical protein
MHLVLGMLVTAVAGVGEAVAAETGVLQIVTPMAAAMANNGYNSGNFRIAHPP